MRKRRKKGKDIKLLTKKPETVEERRKVSHMYSKQPTPEQVAKRIHSWEKKIQTAKLNLRNKDENKTVALGELERRLLNSVNRNGKARAKSIIWILEYPLHGQKGMSARSRRYLLGR